MLLLLTRRPAQAGDLEAALAAACVGGEPLEVGFLPLTDAALPEDDGPLRAMVAEWAGDGRPGPAPGWIVLTSPNAVRALRAVGWDGHVPSGVRVAITGPGTARVLREAGCTAEPFLPPQDRSAAGLVTGLTALEPGGGVAWLPQSDLARPELAEGLRAAGWRVERAVAYETVPYPADARRRLLDDALDASAPEGTDARVLAPGALTDIPRATAVLLTSSSAAQAFVDAGLAPLAGERVTLLAIGRPTRDTALGLGLPLAAACPTPDGAGVLAALATLDAPHTAPPSGE